jgi:crotonobetainyl-CoA:carnitine CoA-transferase CaiB-like acyl-CoA transferase
MEAQLEAQDSSAATGTALPLAGVVVVDFTHILAGPFCTQMLADAGAGVIKVERPGGEYARIRGPRRVGDDGVEVSAYNVAVNYGKESVAVDLKSPAGLEVALALVAAADVAIENFGPGVLARLGVDFARLRAENPRLITASISLFGAAADGTPLGHRSGLAIVAEGESGIVSMQRDREGTPVLMGIPLGDMATGMAAYGAIVTALLQRQLTGQGQHVDLSMVRTLLGLNSTLLTGAQITGKDMTDPRPAAYGLFRCADGWVTIGVNTDALFRKLTQAIGRPELADDPRYASYVARDRDPSQIDEIVAEWASGRTAAEIIDAISSYGVPVGQVATPGQAARNEDYRDLGLLRVVDDGAGGSVMAPASPTGFSQPVPSKVPRIGEHSRDVLGRLLGIDTERYDRLARAGAFGPGAPAGSGDA